MENRKWRHCESAKDIAGAVARWLQDNIEANWYPKNPQEKALETLLYHLYTKHTHAIREKIRKNGYKGCCV